MGLVPIGAEARARLQAGAVALHARRAREAQDLGMDAVLHAERAQVASMRHPPLDRRIIEWKERLEALNGFQPYRARGFETGKELEAHESRLSIPELIRNRDRYGATHYVTPGVRTDLAEWLLHSDDGYSVYDVTALGDSARRPVSMGERGAVVF